jgi:hypothetical protein
MFQSFFITAGLLTENWQYLYRFFFFSVVFLAQKFFVTCQILIGQKNNRFVDRKLATPIQASHV